MIKGLQHKIPNYLFWGAALGFILLNALMLIYGIQYVPLIPAILLIVILAFVSLDKFLLLSVLFVPLSIPLSSLTDGLSVDLHLPTEPLLAGILLIYFIKYVYGNRLDIKILRHPVTLAIYFQIAWMFITSISSTDQLVSFKFLISRLWFFVGFYLLATQLFRKEKNIEKYVWMYIISFTVVIIYTLIRHSGHGFDNQMMAHHVMRPFYKDHTSYGASIAMILPLMIALFQLIKPQNINSRAIMAILILLYSAGLMFSYSRAAWLSVIAGLGVWLILKLRIKFEILLISAALVIAFVFSIWTQIMIDLEQNRQASSGDIAEHVQSMSNISNDQSNLERINRWSCAWRMFKDKPLLGFGPGTYQFEYGSFQRSFEKTKISTDFGILGTAHSEYLLALSESGLLGMLSFIVIMILTIASGVRVYYKTHDRRVKLLSVAVLVGLVTYYVHGLLNNFLDTDKASALFWGYTGMIVAMEVNMRKNMSKEKLKTILPGKLKTKN